ncbi:Lrp/AsnC family transcriptional regulator [Candidatus Bathyarchaeota archaeon]|nr:Lrp/AsnC family transcriptional regulator [Candidatus Bathyarchaeota archaeon]MBT4319758.1 Lrp/AsnC family transcriptional regulator [Candidatus Bathyarchaeota archaeon]MBT4424751.1 Lrp/AsnC family transcriptional regulator [Candidatus Bathyarchaeota archaeon]MBT5642687.1 Lrp/AsnC family transcriptional regulator [Candidatus Bathyarchaeota archaeon]MBT6605286.1 Lrp/AsnC family transcriptional regulator [Candidatus Bathyarchaeota archaeon]
MDELNTKIIEFLTENARLSFRRIAKNTDKSTDTIINHYNQMRENGEIRGSTVVVDIAKIGYEGIAAFQIDASVSDDVNPGGILQTLIEMPNIIVATKTVGEHDLLALAVIHDVNHYQVISRDIAEIKGVKNMTSCIWSGNEKILPKYFII